MTFFIKVTTNMTHDAQSHDLTLLSITNLYLEWLLRYGQLKLLKVEPEGTQQNRTNKSVLSANGNI